MKVATSQLLQVIYNLKRPVFLTTEIAAITGASVTSTTQCLKRLAEKGIIQKVTRGIWGFAADRRFSPFCVIPFLNRHHRAYLSFISALHLHGVISQIPQVITVASTAHPTVRNTGVGTYHVHQIAPDFFDGFDWSESGDYLMAEPEKALADCFYLSARKGRNYSHFPELDLKKINRSKVLQWIEKISDPNLKRAVLAKAEKVL